jgi:hypothetical protein
MKKDFVTLLILILLFIPAACRKSGKTAPTEQPVGNLEIFAVSDETVEAANLVEEANADLIKIKAIYKENESRIDELKAAMNERDIDKVKKIADDLVYKINDGVVLGESAVSKIEQAEEMKINEKFKEYLRLKEESLRKQLMAFEFRRQAGILLRDGFGTKDKQQIAKAKAEFKTKEENFQKYMEAARDLSQQANKLRKESMQKSE